MTKDRTLLGNIEARQPLSAAASSAGGGGGLQLVEVTPDELIRGIPKKQVWVLAAKPVRAVALVLAVVPVGWAAVLSDARLKPEEAALLKMRPGEVRELKR